MTGEDIAVLLELAFYVVLGVAALACWVKRKTKEIVEGKDEDGPVG